MDVDTLARVLNEASLAEFTSPIGERLEQINELTRSGLDKKALLTILKDAGCSKMGTRQKACAVLMCELARAPPPSPEQDVPSGDFWGSLIDRNAFDTGFDELPQPSAAADAALLSAPKPPPSDVAVAPLPPEVLAADAARKATELEPPLKAPMLALEEPVAVGDEESSASALASPPVTAATTTSAAATTASAASATASAATPSIAAAATTRLAPPPSAPAADAEPAPPTPQEQQAALFRKLGDEAYGRKDVDGAQRWFEQALAATPESVPLLSRLAACALARTPPEHALALSRLEALLLLPPPHGDARLKAARSCLALGRADEAVAIYDTALVEEGATEYELDFYATKPSTPSESLEHSAKSTLSEVAKQAADGRTEATYASEQMKRAKGLGREGRVLEACHAARAVRNACTASPLGSLLEVEAHEHAGSLADALEAAAAGKKRLPNEPTCRVVYARLLARRGDATQAEAELATLVDAHAAGEAWTKPPEAQAGFERAAEALAGLRAAREAKAEGNKAYGAAQYERAITAYTAALAADAEGFLAPMLLGNRSQAHAKLGEHYKALEDCHRAIAIDKGAIKMRLRRAACRLELGQPDDAVDDYEAVLELDPENATAVAGLERAEEVASGTDGRKGGLIDFEGEKLDPYEVLNVSKDANAMQIKAAFRALAPKWHPDKHEAEDESDRDYAARMFKRIRIAHGVLSDPSERTRLDEEGVIAKGKGTVPPPKPFHEYYSINTPEGYTRGGDFVSTRRYDPMVGATDRLGRVVAAEKMSRKMIAAQEEAIRLKGPEDAKRLLAPGQSSTSDQYTKYWKMQEERRTDGKYSMKEEKANNQTFFGKKQHAPKLVAQTRYMPLEVEHRDDVQKSLMTLPRKGGHCEDEHCNVPKLSAEEIDGPPQGWMLKGPADQK